MSTTERLYKSLKAKPILDLDGNNLFAYIIERMFPSILKSCEDNLKILPLGLANTKLPPATYSISPPDRMDLSEFLDINK